MKLLPLKQLLLVLISGLSLLRLIHAQDKSGFISIDCGRTENFIYNEKTTGIDYISDSSFINTGESKFVVRDVKDQYQQPYWGLRSFPQGIRNCYRINVTSGVKYLIRASFVYGNYDGKDVLPIFQLHLGPNLWDTVRLENSSNIINKELIHVPLRNYVQVCLVNNGSGVPFISAIELRPLNDTSYSSQIGSLALDWRLDIGQKGPNYQSYRYPEDVHDRFWDAFNDSANDWSYLWNFPSFMDMDDELRNSYQPAPVVMATAATPRSANGSLNLWWEPPVDANDTEYYVFIHFAETEELQDNESRWQYITNHGKPYRSSFTPSYLYTNTISNTIALRGAQNFSIVKSEMSTHPPLINAIEIYKVVLFPESEANQDDVEAITRIRSTYEVKHNWQGDPCAPKNYSWEGLKCSYPGNDSPRIISLDLSSSGLTGEISPSIANLTTIQTLDLSNNNLTGPIPEFLSQLPDLNVLNLKNNKFKGSLPVGLIERRDNGFLSISLCDNPNLTGNESCTKRKKKNNVYIPIVGSILGISLLLLTVAAIWCSCRRKKQHAILGSVQQDPKNRQFTFSEILKITNNKQRILGKGGFGTVYHGYIDKKTQVAIKLLSPSSVQGLEEFHAEVNLLMRVHHINLTSLVGYCNDESNLGLIYEYMANGNLQEHLSESSSNILGWKDRLRIAADAARGLEYLHHGCKPPIVHRDVKSANILLTENFQAKVADFGLSRNFPTDIATHITTGVAGTPGYLDPEYYLTSRLNERSDIYSFGVVLLEIITSRPVISGSTGERIHISQWVSFMLAEGDIYSIVDPRLERNFNVNSAWKVLEIAMACVSPKAMKRPMMIQVVTELKDCLATELTRTEPRGYETDLGELVEMVNRNDSITMIRPSVR